MRSMAGVLRPVWRLAALLAVTLLVLCLAAAPVRAGEDMYQLLSKAAGSEDAALIVELHEAGRELDWGAAVEEQFEGNLRLLAAEGAASDTGLFLVRRLDGTLYLLSIPSAGEQERAGSAPYYESLEKLLGDKLSFKVQAAEATVAGGSYTFVRFLERPQQLILDRVFKVSIMFMFFFVMVGMGLTLTIQDFKLVFSRPKGIAVGIVMQWVLMPLLALGLAYLFGFYQQFPFIYAGMILICACPGGVTSNLMTYYARGDLALSVSLTSLSTVLALFFTPFLLTLYLANIPEVSVPAGLIIQTIIGLVLVPLAVGMLVHKRWPGFAKKATPFFSGLGVFALLMVISFGIATNAEKFADTVRYSLTFYVMVVALSLLGMLFGAAFPRLFKIANYQVRAISMEVGLRNSTLAVTIALLIQDLMGDFYSSMFVTTAIYGISMYLTGFLVIALYRRLLPVAESPPAEPPPEAV